MTSTPLVTVVIPVYNGSAHVAQTVECLLAQTMDDFELLLIDDGSTDDSVAVLEGYTDSRVRVIRNSTNVGLPTTLNIANAHARGRYIARCDQDDLSDRRRLELQVDFLEANQDVHICGTAIELFGQQSSVHVLPAEDPEIKANLVAAQAFIANPTSMIRLSFVGEHSLRFDPNLFGADDYGFWVDCALHGGRFHNLSEPLLRYRLHQHNQSKMNPARMQKSIRRVRSRICRHYFPDLSSLEIEAMMMLFDPLFPGLVSKLTDSLKAVLHAIQTQALSYGQDGAMANAHLFKAGCAIARTFYRDNYLSDAEVSGLVAHAPELQVFLDFSGPDPSPNPVS